MISAGNLSGYNSYVITARLAAAAATRVKSCIVCLLQQKTGRH